MSEIIEFKKPNKKKKPQEETTFDFEATQKANKEKEERLKKERAKDNTSVKRWYRLKGKED